MTHFINLRAQSVGGGVAGAPTLWNDGSPVDLGTLAGLVTGRNVLIATHGFNVSGPDGRSALSMWETLLTLPGWAYIAVLWPGDSSWLHGLDYPVEGNEAIASAKLLAPCLDRYCTGAASLSFVSHSLGARLVLETVRQTRCTIRQAILMAGAIDDTCLGGEYQDAAAKLESISVLASMRDEVLAWAFPPGNLAGGIVTKGSPYWHGALGRFGPAVPLPTGIDVPPLWQIPDSWAYGHHNYLPQSGFSGVRLAPPETVPPPDTSIPGTFPGSTPCWSAAVVSTLLTQRT
ncbi:alpha/beta hydrolase [Pararobbsia silviterrae]|uniref:Alpha/beta hydrolase n=1 Tax=Pararobbsia silviterrae TaxID=1792498 RepID=A0A494Y4Q0_9BURK|nr:alpha/beta hydrolase [Pararobbsia silviterrae]RKP57658.1 alpha/beta hydrolase [Pararobbsia silviterrae]